MTRQIINPELTRNTREPAIRIEKKLNCWICGQEIKEGELKDAGSDLILLSSEPYPFKEKHVTELKKICPAAQVILVDGEMFSWYGSRLLRSARDTPARDCGGGADRP